jgi:hypothetical protein
LERTPKKYHFSHFTHFVANTQKGKNCLLIVNGRNHEMCSVPWSHLFLKLVSNPHLHIHLSQPCDSKPDIDPVNHWLVDSMRRFSES